MLYISRGTWIFALVVVITVLSIAGGLIWHEEASFHQAFGAYTPWSPSDDEWALMQSTITLRLEALDHQVAITKSVVCRNDDILCAETKLRNFHEAQKALWAAQEAARLDYFDASIPKVCANGSYAVAVAGLGDRCADGSQSGEGYDGAKSLPTSSAPEMLRQSRSTEPELPN
jgi:hypothetical protein